MMTLAQFLTEKGMSRGEFAALLGVSEVTVGRYITGARMPRRSRLAEIRMLTRGVVTPDDFVGERIR